MIEIKESERLRDLGNVCKPDVRTDMFGGFDEETGQHRLVSLADHQAGIAQFVLHDGVPEAIHIQYETAKNLYLYGWFVYRFYPVATLQLYTTLEFALRDALGEAVMKAKGIKPSRLSLWHLVCYAVDEKIVRNEEFESWREGALYRAEQRYAAEKHQEMIDGGLDGIEYDTDDAEVTDADINFDYLAVLKQNTNKLRNSLAHGGSTLFPGSWLYSDFQRMRDFINQLYPETC